ncbi:protein kinase [bacterium]|nr:protein kinase [bacterium]
MNKNEINESISNFDNLDVKSKQRLIKAIIDEEDPKYIPFIQKALQDKDVGVRYYSKKAMDAFSKKINPVKEEEYNITTRTVIHVDNTTSFLEDSEIQDIEIVLNSSDTDIKDKLKYIQKLRNVSEENRKNTLFSCLKQKNDAIIFSALIGMCTSVDRLTKAEVMLIKTFFEHEDARVRANSVEAIGKYLIQYEMLEDLLLMLNDDDNRVIANVASSIAEIKHEIIYNKLETMIVSPGVWYRASAAYALTIIGKEEFLPLVEIAMNDESNSVKSLAMKAYQKILEFSLSRPLLEEFVDSIINNDTEMKDVAEVSINKIKNTINDITLFNEDRERTYYLLMKIFEEKNLKDDVIEMMKKLIKSFPKKMKYLIDFGDFLLRSQKLELAIKVYQKALLIEPENLVLLRLLGEINMYSGKIKESIKIYNKILQITPDEVNTQFRLAEALYLSGEFRQSLSEFQQIIKFSQSLKPFALKMAGFCLLQKNMTDIAFDIFNQIEENVQDFENSKISSLYIEIAHELQELKLHKAALVYYRISLRYDMTNKIIEEKICDIEKFLQTPEDEDHSNSNANTIVDASFSSKQTDADGKGQEAEDRDKIVADIQQLLSDRYSNIQFLARGGMGMVLSGMDNKLKRSVAIKILTPMLARNEEFVKRFNIEAQSSARLNHPNIIQIYDLFDTEDYLFFIMEFIQGNSIREHLKKNKRFPLIIFKKIAIQLVDALQYAHKLGIIHRDIKPDNLMINENGNLKIMDFGLAKCEDIMAGVTRVGAVLGTAFYMAPEQILGKKIDIRTDIYSVGATLYELICGRPPFLKGDIKYQHLNIKPPKPSKFNANINAKIEMILLKCLRKKKEDRFQNDGNLLKMLKSI